MQLSLDFTLSKFLFIALLLLLAWTTVAQGARESNAYPSLLLGAE